MHCPGSCQTPKGGLWQVAEQELPSAGHHCRVAHLWASCVLGWGPQVWEPVTPDPEFSGLYPPFLILGGQWV